jgi:putative transposase
MTTVLRVTRSIRIVELGGIYHVTSRGNDGRTIFLDEADFERFLMLLEKVAFRYWWVVLGYCLMNNHIHLLIRVPEGGLSAGMQVLLSGHACWFNRRHGHTGHLFRNRFYSKQVTGEAQLLTAACYVDLNPVAARLRRRPEEWRWSSYRAHVGLDHPSEFLANTEFLKLVGPTPSKAITTYQRFVAGCLEAVSDTDLGAAKLASDQS